MDVLAGIGAFWLSTWFMLMFRTLSIINRLVDTYEIALVQKYRGLHLIMASASQGRQQKKGRQKEKGTSSPTSKSNGAQLIISTQSNPSCPCKKNVVSFNPSKESK